jgi:DNA-binding MarR family transcriptional regulator
MLVVSCHYGVIIPTVLVYEYHIDIMMSIVVDGDKMEYKGKRTAAGDALTNLIPDLLRFTGLLLTAGDRLVAPLELTSARWQILGTVVISESPQPVAWLARDLGANRQNVQRIINDLHKQGFVAFETNPHHRRAQLVVATDRGKQAFDAVMRLQAPWINALADGLSSKDLQIVHRVLVALREKLESNGRETDTGSAVEESECAGYATDVIDSDGDSFEVLYRSQW